jgi:hypothetical protein
MREARDKRSPGAKGGTQHLAQNRGGMHRIGIGEQQPGASPAGLRQQLQLRHQQYHRSMHHPVRVSQTLDSPAVAKTRGRARC